MYTNLGRNVEKFTGIVGRTEGRKEGRKEGRSVMFHPYLYHHYPS